MKRLILVLLVLVWPLSVSAGDIVSKWRQTDGNITTLSMRDLNHIRLDMAPDSYMLLSGQKVYMVSRQEGQWGAMDMDEISGMMKMFDGQAATQIEERWGTYKSTGRTETVAGYKGTVYISEVRDASGKVLEQSETVFCKHQDIVRVNEAWMAVASGMGHLVGPEMSRAMDQVTKEAREAGYGGFLRFGTDLTLISLKQQSLGSGYFNLPEGTEPVRAQSPPSEGAARPDNDGIADTASDVGKDAVDEAKGATIDEVRDGVKNIFNQLFK